MGSSMRSGSRRSKQEERKEVLMIRPNIQPDDMTVKELYSDIEFLFFNPALQSS